MSSALAFIGAYSDEQPRDEKGQWTASAASLFDSPNTMVHGSPASHDELQGGSMFSDDPLWAAGYTTKSDWAGRESFVGAIHSFSLPADAKTIEVRSVHAAEDKLIKMATDLNDGKTVTSLKEAANLVHKHDPALVAIVSRDRNGKLNGGILVRSAKVESKFDPVDALKEGRNRGRELPGNLATALKGLASELAFIGAWSPDQARDEQGRWTDGAGAIHYSGRGGHFSVKQQSQTDVHEVRVHDDAGVRTVREYRDSYTAHAHAVQAAKGLRLAEGIQFVGAEFDEEKHPRDEKGQWTSGDISREDAQSFLKEQLNTFGGLANADAQTWAFYPHDVHRDRLLESFKPHLPALHAALEERFGKTVTVYRAEHSGDESVGIRSFSLSRSGAEEFLGQNYRTGHSDTIISARVPVTSILAIGSTYSGEVLVDSTRIKTRSLAVGDPSPYKLSKFAAQHAAELVDAPAKVQAAIRDEVRKALKNGEGPSGIADRLYGAIDKTPEEIDRIAQTEYVIARTGAKLEQLDQEAGDDADAGKQWVLGDAEHCPTCIELAGQTVPLGEPFVTADGEEFDGPPAHPNCDCDVEEADLSKTRARAAVEFIGAQT